MVNFYRNSMFFEASRGVNRPKKPRESRVSMRLLFAASQHIRISGDQTPFGFAERWTESWREKRRRYSEEREKEMMEAEGRGETDEGQSVTER